MLKTSVFFSIAAFSFVSIFGVGFAQEPRAEDRSVRIRADDLRCIEQHAATYLESEGDPIVIVPGSCPETGIDPAESLIRGRNGVLVSEEPTIVVLRKYELRCILAAFKRAERYREFNGIIRWNLANCREK